MTTAPSRAPRWVPLVAFIGFFLMSTAWALAAPYEGTPDEIDHAKRAAGVVSGQIAPKPEAVKAGSGALQTVPRGLVRDDARCWIHKPSVPVGCARGPGDDRTLVVTPSGAGRYPPLYYAAVGAPLKLWPGYPGLILARLIGAALASALMAAAFAAIWRWSRRRLMAGGVLLAFTPIAAELCGSVNPNGLEIVAAIGLFVSGLPLFAAYRWQAGDPDPVWDRRLLALFGISAIVLVTMRTSGPPWLLVALAMVLAPYRLRLFRALWRDRAARAWSAGVAVAFLAAVAWTFAMKGTNFGDYRAPQQFGKGQLAWLVADHWPGWLNEAVGVLAFLDARMPSWAYLIWESLAAAVLIGAFVAVRGTDRWRVAFGAGLAVLVPSAMQFVGANSTGFITQGRYVLPLLVGVVLIAIDVLERRTVTAVQARSLVRVCVVALLPIQLLALLVTMMRYQQGIPQFPSVATLNPGKGSWHPVLGSWLPVFIEVAGLIVVAVLALRAARPAEVDEQPAGGEPSRESLAVGHPGPAA
jgi:hypothetical protein